MYAEGNQTNEFILRDYEKFYIVANVHNVLRQKAYF